MPPLRGLFADLRPAALAAAASTSLEAELPCAARLEAAGEAARSSGSPNQEEALLCARLEPPGVAVQRLTSPAHEEPSLGGARARASAAGRELRLASM